MLKNIDPVSKTKVVASDRAILKKISVYDILTKQPISNAQLNISNKESDYIYNTDDEGTAEV